MDFNHFLGYFGKVSSKYVLQEMSEIYNTKNAKKVKKAKNANLLQSATQSATTKAYSTTMGRAKKGGRRWSPPGGFNTNSCGGRPQQTQRGEVEREGEGGRTRQKLTILVGESRSRRREEKEKEKEK